MKRHNTISGTDIESPEVDAFTAEIAAVCRKHGMWLTWGDEYDSPAVTLEEDEESILNLNDARDTEEARAIRQAGWDKQAAEKAELKRKVEAGEATQLEQHQYATQCCMERMSASLRESMLRGWDNVLEGKWEKADKEVSYPELGKSDIKFEDFDNTKPAKQNLRYCMLSTESNEHPCNVMKSLGITYSHATPQSLGDQWWFWNCENAPSELPEFLSPITFSPKGASGISDEEADAIIKAEEEYDPQKEQWDSLFFQINRYGDAGEKAMEIVSALGDLIHEKSNAMGRDAIQDAKAKLLEATKNYIEEA
jgi:hypothetical protein